MARYIVKIRDKYFEWSTIVDAPVTYGMTLDELTEHFERECGAEGLRSLPERLERVHAIGTSCWEPTTVEQLIAGNRAGDNETELDADGIMAKYGTAPE